MINKKGFTLVELLAIIVILGTILAVAVPAVNGVINKMKLNAFVEDERKMVEATKSFIISNSTYIPKNVGDTTEVTLSQLLNNNEIKRIKNPADKNLECNGYVLITKTDDNKYTYIPHLNCEENIGSSEEDGLVAHYTFDNYAESTINVLSNPLDFTWGVWPSTANGWNITKQNIASNYDTDGQMTKFVITSGTVVGSSYVQIMSSNNSITSGKTYGVSFYVRAKVGRKIDISMIKNGSPYTTYVTGSKAINVTTEWQRVEVTFTSNYTATDARIQINTGFDLWNDELYIYKPQLEERAPTPFVDGTRTDKVRDYSLSDHDATLLSASSPKWVDIGAGDGAYQFDGVDDYIDLGTDFTPKSSYTKMVWMKTTSSSARNLYSGSASEVMYLSGGAIQISNTWSSPTVSATTNFYDDKWHQIVSVYDGTNGYIYFDGNKLATGPLSPLPSGIQTYMGRYASGSYYIGSIKEVFVYNRALTGDEIKHHYDIEKIKAEK